MIPRCVFMALGWRALLPVAVTMACAGGPRSPADVPPADLGASSDIARDAALVSDADFDGGDGGADVLYDASLDASADVPTDGSRDATADVRADVPGVMMAGYFIPVDPAAVPPPGSECVGSDGVREGDPTIAPPRPVRPLSVSRVTSQRPTFQWILPEGTTGARVEVCADRCCTRVLQTIDAEGTTVRPATALPPGVVFWRMFGRRGMVVGSRASYTWEFGVRRRDAPNDTTWGTIRDFNGDGFDDLVVLAQHTEDDRTSEVLLVPGSERGLQPPLRTGFTNPRLPDFGSVGDFNGDGIADVAWANRSGDTSSEPGWVDVLVGSREGLRATLRLDANDVAGCASPRFARATDWNGDGYSDVVVSVALYFSPRGCLTYNERPVAAFLFVYLGSGRGLARVPQLVIRVDNLFLHPLTYVENALGDLDLDGYPDLHMVSLFSGAGTAEVEVQHFIAYGSRVGALRYERLTEPPPPAMGWVTPLGDLDGDGRLDWSMVMESRFSLYVYRHSPDYATPSETLRDTVARVPGLDFGYANDGADLNGDGLSDVIISADDAFDESRGSYPLSPGRVYVYSGAVSGLARSPSTAILPPLPEDSLENVGYFGWHAMSPGDVNGDGIDDIVMGYELDNSICFSLGRLGPAPTRPDGCFAGWWPSYDKYL